MSAALPSHIHAEAATHLLRRDGQEDLCFALWYPSAGRTRTSALVRRLVLPREGDREVHGNVSFLPPYFERAIAADPGKTMALNGLGLARLATGDKPGAAAAFRDSLRRDPKQPDIAQLLAEVK